MHTAHQSPLRLVVPLSLRNRILEQYHNQAGHLGTSKTLKLIRSRFFWPGLSRDVKRYVKCCSACTAAKAARTRAGLIRRAIATYPFETVCIDLFGPLTTTECGNRYVLAAQCSFTRVAIAKPIQDTTARCVAIALVERVILVHGLFKNLLSDRGPSFIADLFCELANLLGVNHLLCSPYHHSGNGSAERLIRTLGDSLRA